MPKTSKSGASFFGHEGIVQHADGTLSELDPARNVDGSSRLEKDQGQGGTEDRPASPATATPGGPRVLGEETDGERAEREHEEAQKAEAPEPRPEPVTPAKATSGPTSASTSK